MVKENLVKGWAMTHAWMGEGGEVGRVMIGVCIEEGLGARQFLPG